MQANEFSLVYFTSSSGIGYYSIHSHHQGLLGKNTKIVLYTYDSFLLDWDEDEEQELEQIKDTVEPTPINPKATWPFPSGDKP